MDFSRQLFWQYLFSQPIVSGAGVTLLLAVLSQVAGIGIGLFAALARLSSIKIGPRFLFVGALSGLVAWSIHPVLGGELTKWWAHHLGQPPPGGCETWLAYLIAVFGGGWVAAGLAWRLWPHSPRWMRWIGQPGWYPLRSLSGFYLWLFRGTPLLVQLFFVYFALPDMTGRNLILDEFKSAFVALSLNEGAYMAEIIRAGITSVDGGQMEAALSVGMRRGLAMRRIVIPQAVRVIIPPTGNEFISMLKNTSLAYAIAVQEIFWQEEQIRSANFQSFTMLSVISIWYLGMTSVATVLQGYVERYFERGFNRDVKQPGAMQRLMVGALRRG